MNRLSSLNMFCLILIISLIPLVSAQLEISTSDVKFKEGTLDGFSKVTIKNVGSEGGWNLRVIECTEGFSSKTSPIGFTLKENEEKTFNVFITGSSQDIQNNIITGLCTIEVKEVISQQITTKTFGIQMTQIAECSQDNEICSESDDREVIKKCKNAIAGYEIIEICSLEEKCIYKNGEPICEEPTNYGFYWIIGIIALILILVIFYFIKKK